MKKFLISFFLLLVVIIVGAAGYVKLALPNVGDAPDIKVDITPERIQRGEYLAKHVTVCMDCHSTRDWTVYTAPPKPGTLGKGGEYFGQEVGFPGKFYSKNITPAGLKDWTDGEIFRAITTGVDKNGKALFPVMPYVYYRSMDKEDIYDIIAYLRQLPAIENAIPASSADFPMNFILNTIPKQPAFTKKPSKDNQLAYGQYLVNASGCMECHTQVDKGMPIPELAFSGGREFVLPSGKLHSANITPDTETGLGEWTESRFIERFKMYLDLNNLPTVNTAVEMNTIMPWSMYAGMDTTDLRAVYAYLKTVRPIKNKVEKFSAVKTR